MKVRRSPVCDPFLNTSGCAVPADVGLLPIAVLVQPQWEAHGRLETDETQATANVGCSNMVSRLGQPKAAIACGFCGLVSQHPFGLAQEQLWRCQLTKASDK